MDLSKLSKAELLIKCDELGLTKVKSKTKPELIGLLQNAQKPSTTKNVVEGICIIKEHKDEGDDEDNSDLESDLEEDTSVLIEDADAGADAGADITAANSPPPNLSGYKFIDLFCGIGGFHQALHKMGATCVLACDIDKECRVVYKDNYGIEPVSNVKDIDEKTMDDFDILCAGFPCQAFSNGGKKKCFDDERGLLFDEIVRIARAKQPRYMFLENVKHILKVSNGEVIAYIKSKIASIGYKLQLFQISPHNFGIPQQRERVYFVCVRNDIYNGTDVVLPTYLGKMEFQKFLDKKEDIHEKYFIKGDISNVIEAWDEMVKQFDVGEKISPTIMMNDAFKTYTPSEFDAFPVWKKDYITKNKPLIEKYRPQFAEWYKRHFEVLKKREIYAKLEWQTGPIKHNDSIFNHFIQMRQSGIRVKKGQYFPTLVAISQIPIYGKEKRYITPRECARLQSFPESFKLSPDDKKSYKQLGNSVNVDNVFTVISSTLKKYI